MNALSTTIWNIFVLNSSANKQKAKYEAAFRKLKELTYYLSNTESSNPDRAELLKKLGEVLSKLSSDIQYMQKEKSRENKNKNAAIMKAGNRFYDFISLGSSGKAASVDLLMSYLDSGKNIATTKLVDFCLGLVSKKEGIERMHYYLNSGSERQRNYAALYFKRKGEFGILEQAVTKGRVDKIQAFSR